MSPSDDRSLPLGWEQTTLGSIGTYLNGRGFKKSEWRASGRPIIRIQDLTGSGDAPNHYQGAAEQRHEVQPGDLLVSWAATLGVYVWHGPPAVLNQHIFKVESRIDRHFHFYLLQHALDALRAQAHGSGMVHVTKGRFDDTDVLLPPLPEQPRIVAALDSYFSRLDAATAALERAQANLKRYRASVLKAAVEGRLVPTEAALARAEGRDYEPASALLKRILVERRRRWEEAERARLTARGTPPEDDRWKSKYEEPAAPDTSGLPELPEGWCWATVLQAGVVSGGLTQHSRRETLPIRVPYLRVANVYADELRLDEVSDIGVEPGEVDRALLVKGDLLVVEGNGSIDQIGRVAMWDGRVAPCLHQNHLIKVRFVEPHLAGWTLRWLLSPGGRKQIERVASSTSGLHTLSLTKVAQLAFPVAPRAEQGRVLAETDRLLTLSQATERMSDHARGILPRLRQGVLQSAFEGRLVDQDPTDEPAAALLARIQAERSQPEARAPARRGRRKTRTT